MLQYAVDNIRHPAGQYISQWVSNPPVQAPAKRELSLEKQTPGSLILPQESD